MNAVDATDRAAGEQDIEPPSLLTIILDTNPHAWALLEDSLPLSQTVANLLVFINAHLAINYANKVAVIASHSERAEWLYPTPARTSQTQQQHGTNGTTSTSNWQNGGGQDEESSRGGPVQAPDDANKYRPFAQLEHSLLSNLRELMRSTTPDAISNAPSTMLAGALTRALAYISKQSASLPSSSTNTQFNYSDPSSVAGGNDLNTDPNRAGANAMGLTSRILIVSVSGDLADKYIEIMNSIFACQRLGIPIDVLKLAGDPVFLQQAADTTGGIYLSLSTPQTRAGLLQYLMFAYLPDQTARQHLIVPGESEGVDFRAACFCHKKVVDIGYVCSICLSIFCTPLADGECLLCGSQLRMENYGQRPVVVARAKKKKKKKAMEGGEASGSAGGTPAPG
ncbi:Transcription factor Tfb4 [Teratosphaeria destructans]|uniref:General transcription and DNA repair factor IIH subunit TFB4 n=1 Tax=Teratosphaeria destructans TaxID=418781 RepID=A0A9W7W6F4_9PEZI|nr:Transcription factor Tfb4 [Teratosphaeria destructans]